MGQPFDEPPYPPLSARDFGPGKAYRLEVHNGGWTVTIGIVAGPGIQLALSLVTPTSGTVDVIAHGLPGRFIERIMGSREIPVPVVCELLRGAGVAGGTPLRLLTCHAAAPPLNGPAAAQSLATEWGGPVVGANGVVQITQTGILVHLVEWEADPMGGMGVNHVGFNQGSWITHHP